MNDSIQRQTTRWSMNSYDSIGRFRFLETVYVQDFLLSQFQHLPRLFSNVLIIYRNNRNIERKKIRKFDLFVYPGANLKNVHHIQLSFITFPYRWKKKKKILILVIIIFPRQFFEKSGLILKKLRKNDRDTFHF